MATRLSVHDRVLAVLRGEKPDRLPFVDRLEIWYEGLTRSGRMPAEFADMSLTQVHRALGMGQQKFFRAYHIRLQGVEMVAEFEDRILRREADPVVEWFPAVGQHVPRDRAGVTTTKLITPVGTLTIEHTMLDEMVKTGTSPYTSKHAIVDEADFATVEYIVERMEYVPQYEQFRATEAAIGDIGFVVPNLDRVPFQQLLVDYFSSTDFFFALHDFPQAVLRLITVIDHKVTDFLHRLHDLDVPYAQIGANLDGDMTNPKLFAHYCLPYYQRYTDILHEQGKKVGTHTDGNVKPLLKLLPETGLDVCESFSPAPLTECAFDEAWYAWQPGPIIWGGIPSPLLEPQTSEKVFLDAIQHLLETVGDRPIILGVGDMVLPNNAIERVQQIVDMVEGE